jgi:hypothetical protein
MFAHSAEKIRESIMDGQNLANKAMNYIDLRLGNNETEIAAFIEEFERQFNDFKKLKTKGQPAK